MKKLTVLLALAAAAALALSLTACANGAGSKPAPTATPDAALDQPATMPEGGTAEDGGVDAGMGVTPEEAAPADSALSATLDEIYKVKDPGLMLATTAVNLSDANWTRYYTGLESDNSGKLDAAVASEAAIGSQAYSLVLARVKDAADAPAVAQAMLDGIDPVKWVCVQANDIRAVTSGDTVLLVLVDSQLSDAVTADEIVAAYKSVCGGKLDTELTRTAAE